MDIDQSKELRLSIQQLENISLLVADNWKILAKKLGFEVDEVSLLFQLVLSTVNH